MQRLAGSIILLSGWRRAFVAILAGAVAVLGQAPFDFPLVCFLSFPVLVWLLDGVTTTPSARLFARLRPAFAIGWWFGFGYFLAGLWWVGGAVLVESDTYAWALPFVVVGLPILLSFFYGFAAAVARLLWSDGIGRIFALAFGFGLAEWLRQFLFTGFPWIPVGYAAMPVPLLMQSVAVVGATAMNALAVLVFAMPALLSGGGRRWPGFGLAALLVLAHVAYGFYALNDKGSAAARLAVRIVQPNIDLSEKWDEAVRDRVFKTSLGLSAQAPAGNAPKPALIVWPETSVPFLFTDRPDALSTIAQTLSDGQLLIAGAVRTEGAGDAARFYNSVVAIDKSGEIADAVDKVHLVPFGEYLPLPGLFAAFGVGQIVAGPMTYVAGSERHPIEVPGGFRAIPYICYEIIFPALMPSPSPARSFILNVTNDAWFGDTPGPYQHLRQTQIRAVETGLPVVRSANTGISAAIDSRGRIEDALALGARGVIDVQISVPESERSVHFMKPFVTASIILLLSLTGLMASLLRKLR